MKYDIVFSIVIYKNYSDVYKAVLSIEKSVGNLTYKVILFDNSESHEDFNNLKNKYSDNEKVKCIKSDKNVGYGSGNNKALESMSAKYFAIMNPDILVHEGTPLKMFAYMEEEKDTALLSPKVIDVNGNIQHLAKRYPSFFDLFLRRFAPSIVKNIFKKRMLSYEMQNKSYSEIFEADWTTGAFLFIRSEFYKDVSGFDERFFMYFEDVDLCRKLKSLGKVLYFPHASVTHLWKRDSYKKIDKTITHIFSMFLYFFKWGLKIF